jgi:hypothetical protein
MRFCELLRKFGRISWVWFPKWTGYTQTKMIDFRIERFEFSPNSTIGCMKLDGATQCYTLEPSLQAPIHPAIPEGRYELVMQFSARFKMDTPHLLNVPGRDFIEIHPGNSSKDTEGCILPGKTKDVDWVGDSRAAYVELVPKIESYLRDGQLFVDVCRLEVI